MFLHNSFVETFVGSACIVVVVVVVVVRIEIFIYSRLGLNSPTYNIYWNHKGGHSVIFISFIFICFITMILFYLKSWKISRHKAEEGGVYTRIPKRGNILHVRGIWSAPQIFHLWSAWRHLCIIGFLSVQWTLTIYYTSNTQEKQTWGVWPQEDGKPFLSEILFFVLNYEYTVSHFFILNH